MPVSVNRVPNEAYDQAAVQYCTENLLPAPDLIRRSSSTSLYRTGSLVVRVARPGRAQLDGFQIVAAAGLLQEHGVATLTPAAPAVLTPTGLELTVWVYVPHDRSSPFPARSAGQSLRRLHAVTASEAAIGIPRFPPLQSVYDSKGWSRVQEHEALGYSVTGVHTAVIADAAEVAAAGVATAYRTQPITLIHGDLNTGNILWGVEPTPILIDLEGTCLGYWLADLAKLKVHSVLGELSEDSYAEFVAGYGRNPEQAPFWTECVWWCAMEHVTWVLREHRGGHDSVTAQQTEYAVGWANERCPGLPRLTP